MADAPKQGGPNRPEPPKQVQPAPSQPIEQSNTPVADPLQPRPNMKPEEALNASPNHLLVPDPLPPLDRPIVTPPQHAALHSLPLHADRPAPHVEAAIEELRTRLGEMREFLKRFDHAIGGELGALVDYLRDHFGIRRHDPVRDADRKAEDAHIAARRRQEDLAGLPSPERQHRRAEEDAGLAAFRRIQDSSP